MTYRSQEYLARVVQGLSPTQTTEGQNRMELPQGKFTDPEITLEKIKIVIRFTMKKMDLPVDIIQKSLNSLPL